MSDGCSADCLPNCTSCSQQLVHIYLLPLPAGLPLGTKLARLAAQDTAGRVLKNTTFAAAAAPADAFQPNALSVQTADGRATLTLAQQMAPGTQQKLHLRSSSVVTSDDKEHKYASTFKIFAATSKYNF